MKRNKQAAAAEAAAADALASYRAQAEDLLNRVDPYRRQFVDTVTPLAEQAYKSGAHAAHTALERVTPALDDAWDRVTPAVETARAKVQGEFLPRLNAVLAEAAGHPVALEAAKRGRATAAALRGELEVADAPKKRRFPKVLGVLAVVAAVGGVAVAVKKYLDSRDAEWEAPAPSTYGGSNAPKRAETSPWAAASDSATSTAASPVAPTPAGSGTPGAAEPATPESADAATDAAPADSATADTDATAAEATGERRSYGAGSYVGTKPPAGFDIKGNERSMKYHAPDSPAYERTISDVWFSSTEAAEANGFTKAQR